MEQNGTYHSVPCRAIHRWGPEPARVLLIHGITSSGATMWRLGEGLAERGVVAPDLRGHGEAPLPTSIPRRGLRDGLGTARSS